MTDRKQSIVSDEILMGFMDEMRASVEEIKKSVSKHSTSIEVNKQESKGLRQEIQDMKNARFNVKFLWGVIVTLLTALASAVTYILTHT